MGIDDLPNYTPPRKKNIAQKIKFFELSIDHQLPPV
jgi:hypothetical protein